MDSFEAFCAYLAANLKATNGFQSLETAMLETTFDELGFDSLHIIEATMEAEKVFGVEIDNPTMENCTTVGDLYNLCLKLATSDVA